MLLTRIRHEFSLVTHQTISKKILIMDYHTPLQKLNQDIAIQKLNMSSMC
jgi:hypothetical protein